MMNGLKLIATGRALPEKAMTNDDMRQFVDTSDEWISTRTGIRQRYFCGEGENTTTLSIQAARIALEQSGVSKEDIGCVLVATSSGEYAMPSTACLVHAALELPQNIPAMDVGAACAGFLFAMETARGLLLANDKRYALVIGAEQMSAVLDMQDRNTCVLFGDGAGAAVFELCKDAPYEHVVGVRGDTLIRVGGPCREQRMTMDGQAVFRFAVTTIPQCVNELCQKAGVTPNEVDWVISGFLAPSRWKWWQAAGWRTRRSRPTRRGRRRRGRRRRRGSSTPSVRWTSRSGRAGSGSPARR